MPSLLQRVVKLLSDPSTEKVVSKVQSTQWGTTHQAGSAAPVPSIPAGNTKPTFVFTPAKATFCLLTGLTLWLFVVYGIRHNTPSASGHLPHEPRQIAANGQLHAFGSPNAFLGSPNAFPPQTNSGATYAAETINTTGFATQPITVASPALPASNPAYHVYSRLNPQPRLKILVDR